MNRILVSLAVVLATALTGVAQNFVTINGNRFMVDLNNRDKTAVIVDYEHKVDDTKYPINGGKRKLKGINDNTVFRIPESVRVNNRDYKVVGIGQGAFADYGNLKYVEIPSTVKSIGEYAFFRTGLVSVIVPSSVESIGDRAFGYCTKLNHMTIPNSVTLGDRVYAESSKSMTLRRKDVENYYDEMNLADNGDNEPVKPSQESKVQDYDWVSSDLDVNIPTTLDEAQNTYVAIIANEHYETDPNVDFAIQDGRTFKTYCEQILGIPEKHINIKENATLNNMRSVVKWMKDIASINGSEARFLVYYSGHGSQGENEITSLLPVDGSSLDEESGYSLSKLYDNLSEIESQFVCVFLDACFSGKQRNDELIVASKGARRAKVETPKGNMIVFSAAQDKETAFAYHKKGHGVFTYYLLKKIKESKGNVTLGDLADYVKRNVSATALTEMSAKQTPITSCSPTLTASWKKITLKEKKPKK